MNGDYNKTTMTTETETLSNPPQKAEKGQFCHLHVHSEFSLLDGAVRIKEMLDHAEKEGWDLYYQTLCRVCSIQGAGILRAQQRHPASKRRGTDAGVQG